MTSKVTISKYDRLFEVNDYFAAICVHECECGMEVRLQLQMPQVD